MVTSHFTMVTMLSIPQLHRQPSQAPTRRSVIVTRLTQVYLDAVPVPGGMWSTRLFNRKFVWHLSFIRILYELYLCDSMCFIWNYLGNKYVTSMCLIIYWHCVTLGSSIVVVDITWWCFGSLFFHLSDGDAHAPPDSEVVQELGFRHLTTDLVGVEPVWKLRTLVVQRVITQRSIRISSAWWHSGWVDEFSLFFAHKLGSWLDISSIVLTQGQCVVDLPVARVTRCCSCCSSMHFEALIWVCP